MDDVIYRGTLSGSGARTFLLGEDGRKHLADEILWDGYVKHWSAQKVCARRLPQTDYETGRPIIIVWPDATQPAKPFVEFYFNERLVKYRASFLGHLAVNVNGEIFNFSHKTNENEAMRHEEYFYRPALGEFAPDPSTGRDNEDNPRKPYHDKFGRLFMRTVHVLKITGLDLAELVSIYRRELEIIHCAPPDAKKTASYADFNIVTRNCVTIIRDGLHQMGFENIRGIFPRDFFVNASYYFSRHLTSSQSQVSLFTLPQLCVPEAAPSVMPPLFNPLNLYRNFRLRRR